MQNKIPSSEKTHQSKLSCAIGFVVTYKFVRRLHKSRMSFDRFKIFGIEDMIYIFLNCLFTNFTRTSQL